MPETKVRTGLLVRFRQLDEASQRKMVRFTWSGLLITIVGLAILIIGLNVSQPPDTNSLLLIGFGAIITLVGILRMLIGLINPTTPKDLTEQPEERKEDPSVYTYLEGLEDQPVEHLEDHL